MAEEDNFDIDIYGDLENDPSAPKKEETTTTITTSNGPLKAQNKGYQEDASMTETQESVTVTNSQPISRQDTPIAGSNGGTPSLKRKEPDSGSQPPVGMSALQIADLNWWTTEDEIRGWIQSAGFEHELKELTFNEHKANGKSKGYAS
jgi:hypothetical protein